MAHYGNGDPLPGCPDDTLLEALLHRPGLQSHLSALLFLGQGNQQCIPPPDHIDPGLSVLPQSGSGSFRTSTASGSTSDDISIQLPDPHAQGTSTSHGRIDSSHSSSGLALFGRTGGLSPVSLQPADDSIHLHIHNRSSRDGESSIDEKRYFCTFCLETGSSKTIGTKSDWKRHETNFHETGEEYRCTVKGCSQVYYRDKDFFNHLKLHSGQQCSSNATTNIKLPQKYAYGCGFCGKPICIKPTSTRTRIDWNDRCDHVAQCMQDGVEWTFTKTILGLLKQPLVHDEWRKVRNHWCQRVGIDRSKLEWHYKTSWTLRQRLECTDFGPEGLEAFLEEAFKLGLQDQNGRVRFPGHVEHSAVVPHTTAADVSIFSPNVFSQDTQFASTFSPSNMLGSMEHLGQNSFDLMGEVSAYSKRHSVVMLDAPPIETSAEEDYSGSSTAPTSGYSLSYSANETPSLTAPSLPPLPPSENPVQDHSKASPGKRLLRRSKSWLSSKRPQQPNAPGSTNHPDLPQGYHRPSNTGRGGRSAQSRAAYEGTYTT